MKFKKIKSYAKINLSLHVTGKLKSKLHKIESLVTFAKLHDTIYIRPTKLKKHKIFFFGKFSKAIKKENTIMSLLKILKNKNIIDNQKFEIKINKNIPQQSGMGGGSMNAASLLNYFIKIKKVNIRAKDLIDLAKLIGSDVILGINPKNTILSSNGNLTKINKKLFYHILITKPNFGCSTKAIYSKVRSFSKPKYINPKQSLFNENNIKKNDNELEKVVFKLYPRLKKIKLFLLKLPNITFVRMTGSGSSIVAYFQSKKAVDIAAKEFKKKFNDYWCITSKTI